MSERGESRPAGTGFSRAATAAADLFARPGPQALKVCNMSGKMP